MACKNIASLTENAVYTILFQCLIPMQPQNKICTAYSRGTIRQPQEFFEKIKVAVFEGSKVKVGEGVVLIDLIK